MASWVTNVGNVPFIEVYKRNPATGALTYDPDTNLLMQGTLPVYEPPVLTSIVGYLFPNRASTLLLIGNNFSSRIVSVMIDGDAVGGVPLTFTVESGAVVLNNANQLTLTVSTTGLFTVGNFDLTVYDSSGLSWRLDVTGQCIDPDSVTFSCSSTPSTESMLPITQINFREKIFYVDTNIALSCNAVPSYSYRITTNTLPGTIHVLGDGAGGINVQGFAPCAQDVNTTVTYTLGIRVFNTALPQTQYADLTFYLACNRRVRSWACTRSDTTWVKPSGVTQFAVLARGGGGGAGGSGQYSNATSRGFGHATSAGGVVYAEFLVSSAQTTYGLTVGGGGGPGLPMQKSGGGGEGGYNGGGQGGPTSVNTGTSPTNYPGAGGGGGGWTGFYANGTKTRAGMYVVAAGGGGGQGGCGSPSTDNSDPVYSRYSMLCSTHSGGMQAIAYTTPASMNGIDGIARYPPGDGFGTGGGGGGYDGGLQGGFSNSLCGTNSNISSWTYAKYIDYLTINGSGDCCFAGASGGTNYVSSDPTIVYSCKMAGPPVVYSPAPTLWTPFHSLFMSTWTAESDRRFGVDGKMWIMYYDCTGTADAGSPSTPITTEMLLDSKVLTTSTQYLVTLAVPTALAASFNHLMIVVMGRCSNSGQSSNRSNAVYMFINFDSHTGDHYRQNDCNNNTTNNSAWTTSDRGVFVGEVAATGAASGCCGMFTVLIPNFRATGYARNIVFRGGSVTDATAGNWLNRGVAKWVNTTDQVQYLTFMPAPVSSNSLWLAGSSFYLYGFV